MVTSQEIKKMSLPIVKYIKEIRTPDYKLSIELLSSKPFSKSLLDYYSDL